MKQYAKTIKLIILIYMLVVSISSCSDIPVAEQMDCYAPDRYLLANEYGEPLWSISHIYVSYTGGNPMLAAASDAVVVAVKSTIISNGIAAYDLKTGEYIWGKRNVSPSILVANQNIVYEGKNETIIILDAASGKSLGEVNLPGVGYIVSFYRNDDDFFVFGSSRRFAIYDLTKETMSITEPDFAKRILFKEDNIIYLLDRGQIVAKDTNSGSVIWKTNEFDKPIIDIVANDDMIFSLTSQSTTSDGSLFVINKKDGSSAWKKDLHIISNVDVTDSGVYFLTTDGYLIILNPQNGEEIAKMEFSARPFEWRYSNQELIGSYLIDVNQENGIIAISLGDSCQIMAIKIKR